MVGFTNLPNELIVHILRLVDPADLENAAQMSKHVRTVAANELMEHRNLIQATRNPELFDTDSVRTCQLARTLINDPHRGQYHRKLLLNISFGQHPVMAPRQGTNSPLLDFLGPRTTFERVRREMVDRGHSMVQTVDQYSTEVQLAMILLRVPNVFALLIHIEEIAYLGDSYPGRHRRDASFCASELRVVCLAGEGVRLYHIALLGRIPSVKVVILCDLEADAAFTADLISAAPISIEALHIQTPPRPDIHNTFIAYSLRPMQNTFNANSLHALLTACDHTLTMLTIDRIHCVSMHYPPEMHVPFLTDFAQILNPVRASLRYLSLTDITWPLDGTDLVQILTSPLTHFTQLVYLETHIDEIVYPDECPPSIKRLKFHKEKYFPHSRECGCGRAKRVLEEAARLRGVDGWAGVGEVEFLCHVGSVGDDWFRKDVEWALELAGRKRIMVKAPDVVRGRLVVEEEE
ncbi:MAG: hypothetical protein Q9212_003095 [Teloschistes hypoglaucus]